MGSLTGHRAQRLKNKAGKPSALPIAENGLTNMRGAGMSRGKAHIDLEKNMFDGSKSILARME